jgi:transposase
MAPFFAGLEPCRVGIEACATAHFWARELGKVGHQVKLMAPSYVKPYVKGQKNDSADAEAICKAMSRPSMRFVDPRTADRRWTCSNRGEGIRSPLASPPGRSSR